MGEMSESTDLPNPRKLWGLMERVQLQGENKEGVCLCVQPTVEEDPRRLSSDEHSNTKNDLNIQSTHCHLGFDKFSSNLIYIPIVERILLTNHPQFIMLTDRQFHLPAKPFSSFYLHCLHLEYVTFHQRCLLST